MKNPLPQIEKYTDSNNNGIIDSHEKWFLIMRVIVLLWCMGFLTFSYVFKEDEIDRTFPSDDLYGDGGFWYEKN